MFTFIIAGNDNILNLWSAAGGGCHSEATPQFSLSEHCAAVKAVAWCPWQPSILATGGGTADRWVISSSCTSALLDYSCLSDHPHQIENPLIVHIMIKSLINAVQVHQGVEL